MNLICIALIIKPLQIKLAGHYLDFLQVPLQSTGHRINPFKEGKLQLLNGFKFGFPLHVAGSRIYREAHNLKSAREAHQMVEQKLAKEVFLTSQLQ